MTACRGCQSLRKALPQLAWEAEAMTGMEASRRIHELALTLQKPRPRGRPPVKRLAAHK